MILRIIVIVIVMLYWLKLNGELFTMYTMTQMNTYLVVKKI